MLKQSYGTMRYARSLPSADLQAAYFTYYIMRMRISAWVAINVNKQTGNVCIKCKQSYERRYIASFIKLHVRILTLVILMHFWVMWYVLSAYLSYHCLFFQVDRSMLEKDIIKLSTRLYRGPALCIVILLNLDTGPALCSSILKWLYRGPALCIVILVTLDTGPC